MASERRLMQVPIYGEEISDFFTGDLTCVEGLPDDITLKRTYEDPRRQAYVFIFESEEFPVVEEGEEIPETDIVTVRRRVNSSTHWVCGNCHETHDNGDIVTDTDD